MHILCLMPLFRHWLPHLAWSSAAWHYVDSPDWASSPLCPCLFSSFCLFILTIQTFKEAVSETYISCRSCAWQQNCPSLEAWSKMLKNTSLQLLLVAHTLPEAYDFGLSHLNSLLSLGDLGRIQALIHPLLFDLVISTTRLSPQMSSVSPATISSVSHQHCSYFYFFDSSIPWLESALPTNLRYSFDYVLG